MDPNCTHCHRGIVVELWKRGVLLEDVAPAASAASYRAGLAEIARFPMAEQQSSRLLRLATLLHSHLGTVELNLNRPTAAVEAILPARRAFHEVIPRDALDARARFDLGALDLDLGQAELNRHQAIAAEAAFRESLACADDLLRRNLQSVQWQLLRLRALLGLSKSQRAQGKRTDAAQSAQEASRVIATLTSGRDISVESLSLAAERWSSFQTCCRPAAASHLNLPNAPLVPPHTLRPTSKPYETRRAAIFSAARVENVPEFAASVRSPALGRCPEFVMPYIFLQPFVSCPQRY